MDKNEFREATERRKRAELDDDKIEDAARNEISRRFGEGNPDAGAARQQQREDSNSLRSDVESDSVRPDVQRSDGNPDAVETDEPNNSGKAA